jgi:iron complex outermembrane receptor protein
MNLMTVRYFAILRRAAGIALILFPGAQGIAQRSAASAAAYSLKRLTLEELMEIEVRTVSRHPEKLSETPASIRVITGEEIRRSGATVIPQALRLASQLHVAQVSSSYWTIGARGFNSSGTTSNKLLVMIDGRSVYTPLFSGTYWDSQDVFLPDVDRIEVINGPGGALWGANAVNGVISIITKRASETQGGLLYGGAGNEEQLLGGFRYGGRVGASGHYRVYARHLDFEGAIRTDGRDMRNRWVFSQAGFRADWNFAHDVEATFQGDLYTGWIAQPTSSRGEFDGGNLLGRVLKRFTHDSTLTVQSYFDSARRGAPDTFADRIEQADVDVQHEMHLGVNQHTVVWGINHRTSRDRVRNLPTRAFIPATFTHRLYSAFAHAEFAVIPEQVRATAGVKFEYNNYSGSDILPNVRLAWLVSPQQTIWAAISRAVRTPSRLERDLFIPPTPPFLAAGGPNYGSEELWAYEVGWRGRLAEKTSTSITGFVHDYDDLRTLEQPAPFVFANGLGPARTERKCCFATSRGRISTGRWDIRC